MSSDDAIQQADHRVSTWCIWTGDGPLIVMPREAAPLWEGTEEPSGGRVVEAVFRYDDEAAPATDYDRACDVGMEEGTGELLTVGNSWAVVPGWGEGSVAFFDTQESGIWALVCTLGSGTDTHTPEVFRKHLFSIMPEHWETLSGEVIVEDGFLVAFHAADVGAEMIAGNCGMTTPVFLQVTPGKYRLERGQWEKDNDPMGNRVINVFYRLISTEQK